MNRRFHWQSLATPKPNLESHERLGEAMSALGETDRLALTLYYMGGVSCAEIGKLIGASEVAIRNRLYHARKRLKKEMIEMMQDIAKPNQLHSNLAFRIVELIKQTEIHPIPRATALLWALTITGGLIAILLSFSLLFSPFYPIGEWIGSVLPIKTKIAETGEIPADAIELSKITILASERGDGDLGAAQKEQSDFDPVPSRRRSLRRNRCSR